MKTLIHIHRNGCRTRLSTILVFLMVAMSLLVAPTAAAQSEEVGAQALPSTPTLTVNTVLINLHGGAGVTIPVVGTMSRGEQASVIGYNANGPWWQVLRADGTVGWVRDRDGNFTITGDVSALTDPPVQAASTSTSSVLVFQTSSGGAIYAVDVDPTTGLATSSPRYLTTGIDPAVSPDGQWVAFTRWTNQNPGALGSLWKMRIDGSEEQAILENIHSPLSPSWSGDGTRIALQVQNGGRTTYESTCTGGMPDGPIYDPLNDDGTKSSGIHMKFKLDDNGDPEMLFCYTLLPHPYWGIQVVDAETGEGNIINSNRFSYSPAWDPVNDWRIVYRDDEKGLAVADIVQDSGWAFTTILPYATTNDIGNFAPTFSPDGSQVAVTYWQSDHWDIHTLNAAGGGEKKITETPLSEIGNQILEGEMASSWNNAAPAWSPSGNIIAFVTDRTGQWEIWVMGSDGSTPHPLFADGMPDGITLEYNGVGERVLSWR